MAVNFAIVTRIAIVVTSTFVPKQKMGGFDEEAASALLRWCAYVRNLVGGIRILTWTGSTVTCTTTV